MGLAVDVGGRFEGSFPVISGVYVSDDAKPPFDRSSCTDSTCLKDYVLFDLNFSYNLSHFVPLGRSTTVFVTWNNVFNNKHLETIGAPQLSSMLIVRVQQHF